MIQYVAKEVLYPKFGDYGKGEIRVRADLPKCVREFVSEHEVYHSADTAKFWLWREIKANAFAAIKHPIGLIATAFMSLSPGRLKYYVSRFKNGK
jgi:hypothetical protein